MKKYQVFKVVLFMITALVYNNVSCSEKSESKKSNVLYKSLKALAIAVPIITSGYQYSHHASKPCGMDKYPHAKSWFDAKSKEYPVADLDKAEFCEDVLWGSSGNRIFFPTAHLQGIDRVFSKKMSNQTLNPEENEFLGMNEFLLLHEAGHRKNDDTGVGAVAIDVAKRAIISGIGSVSTSSPFGIGAASVVNAFDGISSSLEREERADKFARDHAQSSDVLHGGLRFFNLVTESNNLALKRVNEDPVGYYKTIDYFHPHSEQRAQKVVDEINRRWVVDNTCPVQK